MHLILGFLTIGISTIERRRKGKRISYIEKCLRSHLKPLSAFAAERTSIVILLGDDDVKKRLSIQNSILKRFPAHLSKGTIRLIHVPRRFYQPLNNNPQNFGDSPWRVKWRSKQTLDFAFLAYFCSGLGQYYLHLEDDIQSDPDYYKIIKQDLNDEEIMKSPWIIRQYWYMGFIGKLIKNKYLKALADFWSLFYYEMPLDWIYSSFIEAVTNSSGEVPSKRAPFNHLATHSSSDNDDVLSNVFADKLH